MDCHNEEEEFEDASEYLEDKQQTYISGAQAAESYKQENVSKLQDVPAPSGIVVQYIGTNSVTLAWKSIDNISTFKLTYCSPTDTPSSTTVDVTGIEVEDLCPGTEYTFKLASVSDNGDQSVEAEVTACTRPVPPENFKVESVGTTSVTLVWDTSGCEENKFHVLCSHNGRNIHEEMTESSPVEFHDLSPGKKYTFTIKKVLPNDNRSKEAVTYVQTRTKIESILQDLGLEQYYPNKLSLSEVLQIDMRSVTDEPDQSLSSLPWLFLKKLMMVNVTARSVKYSPNESDELSSLDIYNETFDFPFDDLNSSVNPLDIVTALFLCSDGFLQQEMVSKMSMCQFSVPLLLPNCDTEQCMYMLWAMRDIVKKFRPHSLSDQKGFVEERIVHSELPLVSFVRLGKCSISKSQILNKLLSNPQQYHDTFVHHDMDCGDIPRRISNGLVEMSWYLPCGNKNIDVFPEPVAFANLRGDISDFETQYSFLCQTSTAVFVFFDNLNTNYKLLTNQHAKAQIFLVGNVQSKAFDKEQLKMTASEMSLKKNNVILKNNQNDAHFVKNLLSTVNYIINYHPNKASVEGMDTTAHELGIQVDEDIQECQKAKQNAHALTKNIKDTLKFKEEQLPLQGKIWKDLAKLEKEQCRLRKAGDQNIEIYKSDLQIKKTELRKQQSQYDISEAMSCFISALTSSSQERSYFLKWMRMNLDNLSRKSLSSLREQYKEKCQQFLENKENKEITQLDQQISNSSLGIEHFLREMGQLYEAAVSLPENIESRQQLLHLPRLCAELMLDGFPLELVDGDASNIPLTWVNDVLCYLNSLVQPNNKMMVVTVLGVQSTGKSTLLNTMFGVQFAVSSGRCTRGAFMQLIEIKDDIKQKLGCDYLLIIDTEGLKSPELAKLDDSYEHDNELATLVVGLSDITIINIAMENSTEMKDILQIVVHAILRMKEIGKKPKCQFVHQNVADVSAHDKNMRDRKLLLEQLNEMTEAAAKMEKKEEYKKFTDVMEYDPETCNWYIPGLWHGNPPMAPVNAGYSEAVYDLKKNMIDVIGKCINKTAGNNITEFLVWTKSLWNAVKYENFIFSFRNSLVADAYMRLCAEFHKWEWSFKKDMHSWLTQAETRVSNFEILKLNSEKSDIKDLLFKLKQEAAAKLDSLEKTTMENLSKYFKQTEGHVYLVEKYKEEFVSSVKSLRRETESLLLSHLEATVDIRRGMNNLDNIKKTFTDTMEKKVLGLLEDLRKNKTSKRDKQLTEKELDRSFEQIWQDTLKELSFTGMKKRNVFDCAFRQLRSNMKQKGSSVAEKLAGEKLENHGHEMFKITKEVFYKRWYKRIMNDNSARDLQNLADDIIQTCSQFVVDKIAIHSDYHDNYIQEILHIIDDRFMRNQNMGFTDDFELSLKLYICGFSARQFEYMHEQFIKVNDPRRCLDQFKDKYLNDFKDLFHDRDQCQRKAEEFTKLCLMPAVETFIYNSLGPDIVDKMIQGKNAFQFSTRAFFQYTLLKQLLNEDKFEYYVKYVSSYEGFVKGWISEQITKQFSDAHELSALEECHLKTITKEILESVKMAQNETTEDSIKGFIQCICRKLGQKLVIPKDALETVLVLNNASQGPFADWLTKSVEEMEQTLQEQLKKIPVQSKLFKLKMKPQDELFKRVFGCGKQCPFCSAPCEAGGEAHTEHCASVHRPQGLGRYRFVSNEKLVTSICSTDVHSETHFQCFQTDYEPHPYKRYREIFPDWHIPADASIQASDYWKYVMAQFNTKFAEEYNARPAEIPETWKKITKKQAENSLKESISVK